MMMSKLATGAVRAAVKAESRRQMGVLAPLFGSGPSQNGLDEQFSGTPALVPLDIPAPTTANAATANGITLVSEDSRSPLATVSITVGVGTRDTTLATSGTALLLKHLAFGTTENRSALRARRELETIGAVVGADVDRETLTIQAAVQAQHFTTLVEILGDSIANAAIKEYDVQDLMHYVQQDVIANAGAGAVSDAIHAAAYYDSLTLGLPIYGSVSGANRASAVTLAQDAYVGSNMTVVGTGVDHDQFSQGVSDHFAGIASGSFSRQASEYVGGEARVARGGASTDVAVALNAAGSSAAAATVLGAILGAAKSGRVHSLGGRTSGRAGAIVGASESIGAASGFANTYSDGGLVGLVASTNGADVESTFAALAGALKGVADVSDDEVARAKAVLAGNARLAAASQAGRAQAYAATAGNASAADIAAVTTADVKNALKAALSSAPSFAVVGDLSSAPRYNALSKLF